jgi:DNA-binding FadR family transcriptional regulator
VREARIARGVEGRGEVRMGAGRQVVARDAAGPPVEAGAFGPFEIIRARQVLEGELAALAAERMAPQQVDGLNEALALMEDEIRRGITPIRGDRLYHLRIAEAADNGPLLRAVTELFDERNNPLFEQLGQHFENRESWSLAVAEHRAVIDAIAARDPEAARSAMQAHLRNSHDRFADNWPPGEALGASTR